MPVITNERTELNNLCLLGVEIAAEFSIADIDSSTLGFILAELMGRSFFQICPI